MIAETASPRKPWALLLVSALCALLMLLYAPVAGAQPGTQTTNKITASLVAEGPARPGETLYIAIHFRPVSEEWHGYWSNPGDAGYGMQLEWTLPDGWQAGRPLYPVPKRLMISGLMNHVYEGNYAVLVPLTVPQSARIGQAAQIGLDAQWLACTDEICVPQKGVMAAAVAVGGDGARDPRFPAWRAAIPPALDRSATLEVTGKTLRLAIPLPAGQALPDPHIFIADSDLVQYAVAQSFSRSGDVLLAGIQLADPDASRQDIAAILAFGDGSGVSFTAEPGQVPTGGFPFEPLRQDTPPLAWLLLAALAGGLILNIMPCVFPILSLKALSLARAGGSEAEARREGVAYSAGVILACVALGATMLALRAAGEQVGWAFQLQEPWVVIVLLLLAAAISANLAGLFELPSISVTRSGEPASAFATGLLAAVAATPCTGPFMAAALGAALILPAPEALLLFTALGLGLALPFLLIGFVPALRNRLPKPGPWMVRFRKILSLPMWLTALALLWLTSRLGGQGFAAVAMVLLVGLMVALLVVGRLQQSGKMAWPAFGLIIAPFAIFAAFALPASFSAVTARAEQSLLDPVDYSAAALAEARTSGKPVFLWFTADWCVTCKVNEGVAIEREATREAFDTAGVIAMRGDWTRPDPAITQFLSGEGVAGIPLYIWYAPDGTKTVLPQVLTPDSLIDLAEGAEQSAPGTGRSAAPAAGSD